MNSPEGIADGMLALLNPKRESGLGAVIAGMGNGFVNIPGDLAALTRDFFDSDHRWDNETDRIRLFTLLKRGSSSDDLKKLIKLIVEKYIEQLDEEQCKKLLVKIGAIKAGEFAFKAFFVAEVVNVFFNRVIPRFIFSAGLTGIISVGASVSRSIYTSRELLERNPEIYFMLRANGDYDLLYFLVKDYVDPYIEAIRLQRSGAPVAKEVFAFFVKGISNV